MTPTTALENLIAARKGAIPGFWKSGYEALYVNANYKADDQIWDMRICDIRGWGHLTGQGHARKLSSEAAKKIQEGNAAFIADAANFFADHAPQLLERVNKQQAALKAMRPLIAYLGEGEPNDQYDEMLGPKLPELLRMVDAALDAGGGE